MRPALLGAGGLVPTCDTVCLPSLKICDTHRRAIQSTRRPSGRRSVLMLSAGQAFRAAGSFAVRYVS